MTRVDNEAPAAGLASMVPDGSVRATLASSSRCPAVLRRHHQHIQPNTSVHAHLRLMTRSLPGALVWLRQRAPDPHLPAARYRVIGRRSRRGPARRTDRRPVMCDRQRWKHAAVAVRGRFCAVLIITMSGLPDRPDWRVGARLSRTFRIVRLHDRPLHNRVGSQPDCISIHRRRAQNARFCRDERRSGPLTALVDFYRGRGCRLQRGCRSRSWVNPPWAGARVTFGSSSPVRSSSSRPVFRTAKW